MDIYNQAFIHKSNSYKNSSSCTINNERLEFLGDAVLDSIIADILFDKFKKKQEGFLTKTRSKIVQRETLNKLSLELGLDKFVIIQNKSTAHNNYIYGNVFEAFIGAIYVDRGYYFCKYFIENKVLKPYVDLEEIAKKEFNFKSKLVEWGQKHHTDISFSVKEEFTDADNTTFFKSEVSIKDIIVGEGIGFSKKESQQNAAKEALKVIKQKEFQEKFLDDSQSEEEEDFEQKEENLCSQTSDDDVTKNI